MHNKRQTPRLDPMTTLPPAQRQPNGDLLLPAATAAHLLATLARLQDVFECEHGLRIVETGATETDQQTANRQDFVDQLSAAVGVTAGKVPDSLMPITSRKIDHTEAIHLTRDLSVLLTGTQ